MEMSDVIISVENLGKRYILSHQGSGKGGYQRFSEKLEHWAKSPWRLFQQSMESRRGRTIHGKLNSAAGGQGGGELGIHGKLNSTAEVGGGSEEFWALKDVSFEVKQGEVVGIIGRNGAGKSTLLKILSRITEPTEGRVTLRGRVASLLEVGTGFHPELTGRENIFLNGAILGMTKAEIKKKFDEIVAFAEVERFLDTPVKRYSSGMYVRLAFAVAAHLEPEILVVDEVLAVGDAEFQKKCLGKMKDVATGGRTVLFVSHNMGAVRNLCQQGILLEKGHLRNQGEIIKVTDSYLRSPQTEAVTFENRRIRFESLAIYEKDSGQKSQNITFGQNYSAQLEITAKEPNVKASPLLKIFNQNGVLVTSICGPEEGIEFHELRQKERYLIDLGKVTLFPGHYRVSVFFYGLGPEPIIEIPSALEFEVLGSPLQETGRTYRTDHGIFRIANRMIRNST
jgi:lipopolysaccharide transport system ATP-binding protein